MSLFVRSFAICVKLEYYDHTLTAHASVGLGYLDLTMRKYEGTFDVLQNALRIYRDRLGECHQRTANTRTLLGKHA
jgi:hypothetical protein